GADISAVGEDERGWTIPRLADQRLEFVEGTDLRRQLAIALPRRRNEPRHRVRKAEAEVPQQLDRIIERLRIGTAGPRQALAGALRQRRRIERARPHPRAVAGDRVDLAVVRQRPER